MENIYNSTLDELTRRFVGVGLPSYSAAQVFGWLYRKQADDFAAMTDLSRSAREFLKEKFSLYRPSVRTRQVSADGTEKFLFQLADAHAIETVAIPDWQRLTLCVSSQVGCKFNCAFCTSGKAGFKRDLEAGEIIAQYLTAGALLKKKITNIVFMGIGEPLDNFDNVLKVVRILTDKKGAALSARRLCISTSGLIPQIEELARLKLGIKLSVSLHSADDAVRSRLMPVNKKYPLHELIRALKTFSRAEKFPITFEYALISGVNVSQEDAIKLSRLLAGLAYKINLIPLNSACTTLSAAHEKELKEFTAELEKRHVFFTVRKSRGQDIQAACGQLRALFG